MNLLYQHGTCHPLNVYNSGNSFLYNFASSSAEIRRYYDVIFDGSASYIDNNNTSSIYPIATTVNNISDIPTSYIDAAGTQRLTYYNLRNRQIHFDDIDTSYGIEYNFVAGGSNSTGFIYFDCSGSTYRIQHTALNITKDNVSLPITSVVDVSNTSYISSLTMFFKAYIYDEHLHFKAVYSNNPAVSYHASSSIPGTGHTINNVFHDAQNTQTAYSSFNLFEYAEADVSRSFDAGNKVFDFSPVYIELPVGIKNTSFIPTASSETTSWGNVSSSVFNDVTEPVVDGNSGSLVTVGDTEFGFALQETFEQISNRNTKRPRGDINRIHGVNMYLWDEYNIDTEKNLFEFKLNIAGDEYIKRKSFRNLSRSVKASFMFDTPYSADNKAQITVKDIS